MTGRRGRLDVSQLMRPYAAILAVVLASPAVAGTQAPPAGPTPMAPATTPSPVSAAVPAPASGQPAASAASPASTTHADVDRIKRLLAADTPLLESALSRPTFRTSVTERVDIWRFWGDPEHVSAFVRPRGGTWHHEFQNMVTPDEFKGFGGGFGNGERLQLAATSMAFAGAMKLLGLGVQQAKQALHNRTVRQAKEEVQRELEAFYLLHPEARPAASPTPP